MFDFDDEDYVVEEDKIAETATKPPTDDNMCKAIDNIINDSYKTGVPGDLDVSVNMGGYVVRQIIDLPKEEYSKAEDSENVKDEKDKEEDDALLDIKSIENEIEESTSFYGYQRDYRDTLCGHNVCLACTSLKLASPPQ